MPVQPLVGAADSSAARTTPDRQDDTTTVGTANSVSSTIHGLTVISTATVRARQASALTVSISASSM